MRVQCRVSGVELASRLGCTQSMISKLETGKIRPSREYIEKFATSLGLAKKTRDELMEMTAAFLMSFNRWSHLESDGASLQEAVRQRESQTKLLQVFSWILVNGLVQTAEYARAIFSLQAGPSRSEKEIQDAVRVRLKRQKAALDSSRVIQLIFSETALGNWFVSREVMDEQIQKVISVIEEGNWEVRILPLAHRVSAIPVTNFALYDESVVEVETQTLAIHLWEREEIDIYKGLFKTLLSESFGGRKAKEILARYISGRKKLSLPYIAN